MDHDTVGYRREANESSKQQQCEVNVITELMRKASGRPALVPADQTLRSADHHIVTTQERFTGILKLKVQEVKEEIYVLKGSIVLLLGHCATEQLDPLHVIRCIATVDKELIPK